MCACGACRPVSPDLCWCGAEQQRLADTQRRGSVCLQLGPDEPWSVSVRSQPALSSLSICCDFSSRRSSWKPSPLSGCQHLVFLSTSLRRVTLTRTLALFKKKTKNKHFDSYLSSIHSLFAKLFRVWCQNDSKRDILFILWWLTNTMACRYCNLRLLQPRNTGTAYQSCSLVQ